jgi:hypothetical protein
LEIKLYIIQKLKEREKWALGPSYPPEAKVALLSPGGQGNPLGPGG